MRVPLPISPVQPELINLAAFRWRSPIPASCLLQAVFGLAYSTGVFSVLLHSRIFNLAIGFEGLSIAFGILFSGVVMAKCIPPSRYREAPMYIAITGAILLYTQSLMALALVFHLPLLLFASAAAIGLGTGSFYVISVDVLQSWVPEAPGWITALGTVCGGAGSLLGIPFYAALAHWLGGAIPAMTVAGAVAGSVSLFAAFHVQRAPRSWNEQYLHLKHRYLPEQDEMESAHPLLDSVAEPAKPEDEWPDLTVADVFKEASFRYLLVAFLACEGPGFGVVIAFQSMASHLFGVNTDIANQLFFWVTLAALIGRLVAGTAVDELQKRLAPDNRDPVAGARCTLILLLGLQIVAFLSMPIFIAKGYLISFTVAVAAIYITFCGGAVTASCLARGLFTPNNTSLVFALAALSVGFGDMLFSWTVAGAGSQHLGPVESSTQLASSSGEYNFFICCGATLSVLGFAASFPIRAARAIKNCNAIHA